MILALCISPLMASINLSSFVIVKKRKKGSNSVNTVENGKSGNYVLFLIKITFELA